MGAPKARPTSATQEDKKDGMETAENTGSQWQLHNAQPGDRRSRGGPYYKARSDQDRSRYVVVAAIIGAEGLIWRLAVSTERHK